MRIARRREAIAKPTGLQANTIEPWLKLSAVAIALLYVCGWTYLRAFYDHFRIDISQLDLNFNDILIHAALVIGSIPHIFKVYNVPAMAFVGLCVVTFVALLTDQLLHARRCCLPPPSVILSPQAKDLGPAPLL